jgi:LuxR family maltose regulon positive regulatory protein
MRDSDGNLIDDHLLITGKTLPPSLPQPLLRRNRLETILNDAWERKLTLLTAPPGYGKTTLLQVWAARQKHPVGWLRLDERDVMPRRCITYLAQAIPNMPDELRSKYMKWSIGNEPMNDNEMEKIAAEWMTCMEQYDRPVLLIVDAAEHLSHRSVIFLFQLLLDYGPEHLHILIAGRHVPTLSASGNIGRIGVRQLKLSEAELAEYARRSIGLRVDEHFARELAERAGGWFAAIQAYLPYTQEQKHLEDVQIHKRVLHQLSPYFHVSGSRQIPDHALLSLSMVKPRHLSQFIRIADLSVEQLTSLAAEWPFFSPHPDQPDDDILHPLFAQWLRHHLPITSASEYTKLKRQLALQLEAEGCYTDAIEYALDAGDLDLFANMVNLHNEKLLRRSFESLLTQLGRLSESQLIQYPTLAFFYAWSLIHIRRFVDAERVADLLESAITSRDDIRFHDTKDLMIGYLAGLRSMIHISRGETALGLFYTKKAFNELHQGGKPFRQSLYFEPGTASLLKAEYGHYGMVYPVMATYRYLEKRWGKRDLGYAVILVLLGQCYYEINRLDKAESYLQDGLRLSVELDFADTYIPAELAWARLKWKTGEKSAAYSALQEAREQMIRMGDKHRIAIIDACETELLIAQGNAKQVRRWLLRADDIVHNVNLTRMYEAIVLIRAYSLLGRWLEAKMLGERVLQLAERYKLTCYLIEVNYLLANISHNQGDIEQAMRWLHRALSLAHQYRYLNTLIDEGAALSPLLRQYLEEHRSSKANVRQYAERLLQQLDDAKSDVAHEVSPMSALTSQEKRVYHYLMQGFDNRTIATELSISSETIKRHCRHLYRKLGVRNRQELIERSLNG